MVLFWVLVLEEVLVPVPERALVLGRVLEPLPVKAEEVKREQTQLKKHDKQFPHWSDGRRKIPTVQTPYLRAGTEK